MSEPKLVLILNEKPQVYKVELMISKETDGPGILKSKSASPNATFLVGVVVIAEL